MAVATPWGGQKNLKLKYPPKGLVTLPKHPASLLFWRV